MFQVVFRPPLSDTKNGENKTMILKNDTDCIRTIQDAARAAQRRVTTLDRADDRGETMKVVNDLLDAMVRDLESLAFMRFLESKTMEDDDGVPFSVCMSTRCHSAFVLDRLGELRTNGEDDNE